MREQERNVVVRVKEAEVVDLERNDSDPEAPLLGVVRALMPEPWSEVVGPGPHGEYSKPSWKGNK